jgi:hypothetical protein
MQIFLKYLTTLSLFIPLAALRKMHHKKKE